jgi:hypothetical protein
MIAPRRRPQSGGTLMASEREDIYQLELWLFEAIECDGSRLANNLVLKSRNQFRR